MSTWPQGTYGGPPPPHAPRRRTGAVWFVAGVVVLVVAGVVAALMITSAIDTLGDLSPGNGAASHVLDLEAGEERATYAIGVVAVSAERSCTVQGPDGLVPLRPDPQVGTLEINNVNLSRVATFTAPVTGTYRVDCDPSVAWLVAPPNGVSSIFSLVIGIFVAIGGLIVAVVLLVVGFVRRSSGRRAQITYGPPGGGHPTGGPGQPWVTS